ncbi:cytochrome P450 [Phenylobacterium sp.]|uniref:cytochrome P450 n=1 Tax=Phenylobacterium sp. TaxID=1871053 RepID=UPI0035B0AA21
MSQDTPQRALAAGDIQANLVRASRFEDGQTRDWTLFFFFRIMPQAEMDASLGRLVSFAETQSPEKALELITDLQNPSLFNVGLAPGPASQQFRNWLTALVSGDHGGVMADAQALGPALQPLGPQAFAEGASAGALSPDAVAAAGALTGLLGEHARLFSDPAHWQSMASEPLTDPATEALAKGLVAVVQYEIQRQCAPAFVELSDRTPASSLRSEAKAAAAAPGWDPVPLNIAFTWTGLAKLGVDDGTLASFPEPFREGMAHRADRLWDVGASAPAGWEGAFGLPRLHGYFTGGFLVGGPQRRVPEVLWRELRRQVAAFNAPESQDGQDLRAHIGALFRPFGLEILHLELGQEPYDVDENGETKPRRPRLEHFGFRDGLSQPFADVGLGDAGPGAGTPSRDRTWTPVAPGELYLDQPDEDGQTARMPDNAALRAHGTYVVFRKLEQDVAGFRSFLARTAGGDAEAAGRLGAEIVGRWPSGTPLVLSPDLDRPIGDGAEDRLNDFLFAGDDPEGRKCPLGAHIRRANPRDTGGRDEVRRHRLLRRSISYGGPLLPAGSLGDGEPRGLLFVAMNARIDLQFEVVQADWLNGGEFLGQAGLGRCPLVGAHSGGPLDSFVRAGGLAPVTGLPGFVTTRGGEYFFAPGIGALKAIAAGDTFKPETTPHGGYSFGGATTQGLFDPARLQAYGARILRTQPAITVALPKVEADHDGGESGRLAFVGRYADVVRVLSNKPSGDGLEFSVEPYHRSAQRITRGYDFVISTDAAGPTAKSRDRLTAILAAAWRELGTRRPVDSDIRTECDRRLATSLRRCRPSGRIDLVDDLAVAAAYGVVQGVYGVRGPDWLTELAAALPFGRQHLSELPADWLKALASAAPADPGLRSLQTWSAIMLADTIANLPAAQEVWPLSRKAGAEMLAHIDELLAESAAKGPGAPFTLLDAFVANADAFVSDGCYPDRESYLREAAVVLAEVTANTIAATPSAFGSVMHFLLEHGLPLNHLQDPRKEARLSAELARQVVYECDRLNPVLPILQRKCETSTTLPSGAETSAGDRVAALLGAANLDPSVFRDPTHFSLTRDPDAYLMFGAPGSGRRCWGAFIAMPILQASLLAAASLKDLRPVAGRGGGPRKIGGALTIGLRAHFTRGRPGSP